MVGPHLAVLGTYPWFYGEGSLLAGSGTTCGKGLELKSDPLYGGWLWPCPASFANCLGVCYFFMQIVMLQWCVDSSETLRSSGRDPFWKGRGCCCQVCTDITDDMLFHLPSSPGTDSGLWASSRRLETPMLRVSTDPWTRAAVEHSSLRACLH